MKKLGFGLMRLPMVNEQVDIEKLKTLVDAFMERGFTYFDTAMPYHRGNSEIAFREAVVKRYPRESYTITDKLSFFMMKEKEDMEAFFAGQLERIGLDYIDYYFLHGLSLDTYKQALEWGAFEFVGKLKEEGKIKHIGISFHDRADVLEEILSHHPEIELVQIQLNYLDWEDANIQSKLCYEVCEKYNKPVAIMEPLKGGALVNVVDEVKQIFEDANKEMSVASWGIRFAATPKNVMVVLSGMNEMEQLVDNMSYMNEFVPLSESELNVIDKATNVLKSSIAVPCTGCRYCIEENECSMNIAIPDYFNIYNNLKRFGQKQMMVAYTYYNNIAKTHSKASACIECGLCEHVCPQHLSIRDYLKDVAEVLG